MKKFRLYKLRFIFVISLLQAVGSVYADKRQAGFDDLVVFGDSLSDPGNAYALLGEHSTPPFDLIPSAPYAIGGHHFSNGRTWVERFAQKMGLQAGPAFSQAGFNNYAIGGARARPYGQIYLSMQVATFLGRNGGKAPAQHLYSMFIGGNDIRDAIQSYASDPSGALARQILTDALASVSDNLGALAGAGAREFLVLNAPDLSLVPAIRQLDPAIHPVARFLSEQYNEGLQRVVTNLETIHKIEIELVDIFDLLNEVSEEPDEYGLINVTQPCIHPGVVSQPICAKPDSFLFWDGIHPSRVGHKIIAKSVAKEFLDEEKDSEDRHGNDKDSPDDKKAMSPTRVNATH